MLQGLRPTLENIDSLLSPDGLRVGRDHYAPGYWVVLTAIAKSRNLSVENIAFAHEKHRGYASAMGLARALGSIDDYEHDRRNEGKNYSSLAHLDCAESTDLANQTVNGCVRRFMSSSPSKFLHSLCDVIGEVHGNVWAHGMSSGFSMAQKWSVPRWKAPLGDQYFEFALADCGNGFLREIRRSGIRGIDTDQEAIEWCIAEGNSTKRRDIDEWAQSMPVDVIGNPLREITTTRDPSQNHHQGLGLTKLVNFVKQFRGVLWLASGCSLLEIDGNGNRRWIRIKNWSGVALSCRFRASEISRVDSPDSTPPEYEEIMRKLSGADNG